ncbi:MAG: RagB/SusD family nutrient uptake outer membrane protein [Cytophagales bacterium]|nr:RagB/SusD family nutrient uptake outer membrane protein [Cytophagales bacterium]
MKKQFKIGLVIALMFVALGCEDDYLDFVPQDAVNAETFDSQLALTGVYNGLQGQYIFRLRSWNDASLRERECFTDNSMNGYLWQRFNNLKLQTATAGDNVMLLRPWRNLYDAILQANETLANIPGDEGYTEEEKELMIAQAQVLRAYYYWQLVVAWDDVPFLTERTLEKQPKSTAVEIYNALLPELESAAALLPGTWPGEYGRITSHAANALITKMALFFYGYHGIDAALQTAEQASGRIVNSGLFDLYNGEGLESYRFLFTPGNEQDNEIIWSVQFGSGLGGNNGESISWTTTTRPYPNNMPLPNLIDDFYCTDGLPIDQSPLYDPSNIQANRDPRLDATIVFDGEQWLSDFPPMNIGPANRRTGFAVDKYCVEERGIGEPGNGEQDYYIFRYPDILLMRAEALVFQGNTGQEVYDLVNEVRDRVGMPRIEDVEGTGLSADQLTDIIRHERRVELAFEDTRFADLKRWGTMEDAYLRSAGDVKVGTTNLILNGVQYSGERSVILPIPEEELNANELVEQHPAWR